MSPTNSASAGLRLYYPLAAGLFLLVVFLGFIQFYLHFQQFPGRPIPPPVHGLVVTHGFVMSLWMLLYLLQTSLVFGGNKRLHMKLGWGVAALIPVMLVVGPLLAIRVAQLAPTMILFGYTYQQFTIVPIFGIVSFFLLAMLGLYWRNQPDVHRPLMLLATLRLMDAALSRIGLVGQIFGAEGWISLFAPMCLLGTFLLAIHWAVTGRLNRTFAGGLVFIYLSSAFEQAYGHSTQWNAVSAWLLTL